MNEISKNQLFQRQTTLKEFGRIGQQKLQNAKILVIGCGGLGNVASVYLASSGIGKIHLVDFDTIDVSNLHRQVFFKTHQIGMSKAEALSIYIQNVAPFTDVSYSNECISKLNIFKTIESFDIILDCTDSLPVKYLINDACVVIDKVLVYGSLYKFDGYVASFNVSTDSESRTANLRDAFPEIPSKSIPNCSEAGTLNTIVGIIGLMQANEVLKIVSGVGNPILDKLLIYNSLENSQYTMKLKGSFTKDKIQAIFDMESYSDISTNGQLASLLISSDDLKKKIINRDNLYIISVIEDTSSKLPFDVDFKIPLSKFDVENVKYNLKDEYIIVCNKGISSYIATEKIKNKYSDLKVLSLEHGITKY